MIHKVVFHFRPFILLAVTVALSVVAADVPRRPPVKGVKRNLYEGFSANSYASLPPVDWSLYNSLVRTTDIHNGHYLKTIPTNLQYPSSSSSLLPKYGSNFGYNNGIQYPTYGTPLNTYVVNGRVIKQYEVIEEQEDDRILQQGLYPFFDPNAPFAVAVNPGGGNPFLPRNFGRTTKFLSVQNGLARPRPQAPHFPATLGNSPAAIALGSGSLGYITLPNGGVYLGSGSLGYISPQQHADAITARRVPATAAGPLSFGSR